MGKGFKHGAGAGGASSLNYKVVGGTSAPANPRENTIWVNTSKEITDHVFSSEEPAMVEGRVWFLSGTVSVVAFNVLKKNVAMVYPTSAKHCISGAWVDVDFQAYLGGAWKEPFAYLFADGNEFVAITGGWTNNAVSGDALSISYAAEQEYDTRISTSTVNAVDLTPYKLLTVKVASYLESFTVNIKDAEGVVAATVSAAAAGDVLLDISSLNGSYYVELSSHAYEHGGYCNTYFTVTEVHLT